MILSLVWDLVSGCGKAVEANAIFLIWEFLILSASKPLGTS